MKNASAAILIACALTACESHSATDQIAIQALGSTVSASQFDRSYWQRQHDANTAEWLQAKRLCEQTVLTNYPNCLPINDIVQTDQKKRAKQADMAVAKNDEMFRRGYQFDFARKLWLPFRPMMAAGCVSVPTYPNDLRRIGFSTWKCPTGTALPQGIPDEKFREEEENATN
jgi:hypothetical protein